MMELRNKAITCHVSLPDSVVFAVEVDRNAKGLDVLAKVCGDLHILEVDYFGLVYHGLNREELWLNLRNQIVSELSGSPPYQLQLRFKFFVEPHFIQQATTRNQFFMNARQQFLSGKLRFAFDEQVVVPAALLFAIHERDSTRSFKSLPSECDQFLPAGYQSTTYKTLVMNESTKFEKLSEESARNRFLEAVSLSPFFGVHLHEAKDESGRISGIGVGRDGITEYGEDWKLCTSCDWTAIQSATHNGLCVIVSTIQGDGSTVTQSLRLGSKTLAGALYRDITEMRSFYHCDTIGSLVSEQYCRDLKGTIASFFNESTGVGKKYVFDIQRTFQEAYDSVRRILYSYEKRNINRATTEFVSPTFQNSCSSMCQALLQLNDIRESLTCRVCVDADIDAAFVPCGHVVCCTACAQRLDCCPVCKGAIDLVQSVFLPYVCPVFSTSTKDDLAVACT